MESGWRLPLQSFAQPQSPQYFWFWNEKNIAISKARIWFVHNTPHLRSCSKSAKHFFDISKKGAKFKWISHLFAVCPFCGRRFAKGPFTNRNIFFEQFLHLPRGKWQTEKRSPATRIDMDVPRLSSAFGDRTAAVRQYRRGFTYGK